MLAANRAVDGRPSGTAESVRSLILRGVLLLLTMCRVATPDDHSRSCELLCRRLCPPADCGTKLGAVTVRAWPISPITKPIPNTGATLDSVLTEYDQIGLPAAIMMQMATTGATTAAKDPQHADRTALFVRSGTPTLVSIIRQNQVLVFPRVMLLHPTLRNLTIRNGDIVSTSKFVRREDVQKSLAKGLGPDMLTFVLPDFTTGDPLGGSKKPPADENPSPELITIRLSGNLLPQGLVGPLQFEEGSPLIRLLFKKNLKPPVSDPEKSIEESVQERLGNRSDAATPIVALVRRRGPTVYTYIAPLRDSGSFRQSGSLMQMLAMGKVAADAENTADLWSRLADQLRQSVLVNGDWVQVTDLNLFLATSPFGLR